MAAPTPPRCYFKMQDPRSQAGPTKLEPPFSQDSQVGVCTWEFEKPCFTLYSCTGHSVMGFNHNTSRLTTTVLILLGLYLAHDGWGYLALEQNPLWEDYFKIILISQPDCLRVSHILVLSFNSFSCWLILSIIPAYAVAPRRHCVCFCAPLPLCSGLKTKSHCLCTAGQIHRL